MYNRTLHAEIVNQDGSPATTLAQADEVVRRTGAGITAQQCIDPTSGIWLVEATPVVAHRAKEHDVEYRLGSALIVIPRIDGGW